YRAQKPLDLLTDRRLSMSAKGALIRFIGGIAIVRHGMLHGNSYEALGLDRETAGDYLSRMGRGGQELLTKLFEPGLRAALGGSPSAASRFVLQQVVWNTLVAGFWNFEGGVDHLPEALAAEVPTIRGARVHDVRVSSSGIDVSLQDEQGRRTISTRGAILAIPGNHVPAIFPTAPDWIRGPASHTRFSSLSSAHVALRRAPM